MRMKFAGVFISALILLGQTVCAEINVTTVSRADNYDNVTIDISNGESEGWLTVYVYGDDGEQLCYLNQDRIEAKNTFTYVVSPTDKRFDSYKIKATKSIGNELITEEKVFEYFTYAEQQAAIADIISLGKISQENAKILSLPIGEGTLYYELKDKTAVAEALIKISGLKPENILENFNKSVMQSAIKSKDKTTIKLLVQNYSDLLLLSEYCEGELEWFANISDKDSFYARLAKQEYASVQDFCEEFSAQAFLFELSNQPYLQLKAFLNANNNKYSQKGVKLKLSLDAMEQTLKTNDKIEKAMYAIADVCYESLADLKSAFDRAVINAGKADEKGGSAGGIGKSGSSSNYSAAIVEAPTTQTDAAAAFSDISGMPWAVAAISNLAAEGILNGVGNGKFEPLQIVTREQFAKIAVLAFDIENAKQTAEFGDAIPGSWYIPYISASAQAGIMVGNGSVFGINEAITRQDIAVVLYRLLKKSGVEVSVNKEITFEDGSLIADYAKEAVSALCSIGLINGVGDNTFAPVRFATRAETAKLVYELRNYITQQ